MMLIRIKVTVVVFCNVTSLHVITYIFNMFNIFVLFPFPSVSGVEIDSLMIRRFDPPIWNLCQQLCRGFAKTKDGISDITCRSIVAPPSNLKELGDMKGFKIVHLNVRSLVKKIDQIRLLLQGSKIDALTISESWMKQHLHTNLIEIEGFRALRLDRGTGNKSKKRGGGLMTYINNKHSPCCEPLVDLDKSDKTIEAQWSLIHRPHCKNVVICNVYRPPNADVNNAISYLDDCLRTVNLSKVNVFIVGDLNINYQRKSSHDYKKLHFFAQSNGLTQYINNTTRNTDKTKSLIDLALTNSKFISNAGTLEYFISDHQPIYIVHKKGRDTRDTVRFNGRSYRNFEKDAFKKELLSESWDVLLKGENPEDAWDYLLQRVTVVLDRMCPTRSFCIKNYRPDWMTNELIELIKDRDYFYRKAKVTGDSDFWNIAKFLRNKANYYIRQAKREFILNELRENENNAKQFWKTIREIIPSGKNSAKQDILLKSDGEKVGRDRTSHFINDYFVNVGNFSRPTRVSAVSAEGDRELEPEFNCPNQNKDDDMRDFYEISEKEVFNVVKDINIYKSSGITNLSSFVLKEAFTSLIPELTHIFRLSISTGIFPRKWKDSLVIPIPKSGNLTKVQNFRPISLLPLPGKLLEKLVHSQISSYLESEALLNNDQHGFRKGHSTVHSIAQLTRYISTKFYYGLPTLVAFLDFRKAFDCVQHDVLLQKIAKLNLAPGVVTWVASYLANRRQRVLANNTYSTFLPVTQGVLQGSVLGPLFYIIYANDLISVIKNCGIALYADDTVLYSADKKFISSVTKVQEDLNAVSSWCHSNGIMLNTDKTKVMVFGS